MLLFLFRGIIFDVLYSFIVGGILLVLMLPFVVGERESREPSGGSVIIGFLVGLPLCAVQGLIFAAAFTLAMEQDPSRIKALWWLIGAALSTPLALAANRDPEQASFRTIGWLCAVGAFAVGTATDTVVPGFATQLADRFLI